MGVNGEGVEQSIVRGYTMLGVAGGMGSEHACGLLGEVNAEGRHGFDKDPQEATKWYREMQTCTRCTSSEEFREQAAAWLREQAEAGDADAVGDLGFSYRDGMRGLQKDASFMWLKRAADRKDVDALTVCGVSYVNGE